MAAADKEKLDGVEVGASADQTGAELIQSIDDELGAADWREPAARRGAFHGKSLGPSLLEKDGAIDVNIASLPRTRVISRARGRGPVH